MNSSEIMSVMELLDIKEVTTKRQRKNGTREFELPIKHAWGGHKIRVASFKSGYVRNQGKSCRSNYQLNKRYDNILVGTRGCILMPREIDRLEYLIRYCLKNYYIKHANFVADGEYIPKWTHKWELERANQNDCGHYEKISELEQSLIEIEKIINIYKHNYGKDE